MIKRLAHIGLTVKSVDETVKFYTEVLGLKYIGEILMEGKETDLLFDRPSSRCKVAYVTSGEDIQSSPLEFIEFLDTKVEDNENKLHAISISEICFEVKDIDKLYERLINHNVKVLSKPQNFDFEEFGFSKSKAIYFKDNNGITLEAMEYLK